MLRRHNFEKEGLPTVNTHIDRTRSLSVLVALMLLVCAASVAAADRVQKVAIVPFTINAEKDLSFLQHGISDMFSSRLTWPGKVAVVDPDQVAARSGGKTPADAAAARSLGAKLAADYVLYGSLTVLGASVSIDTKIVKVAGSAPARAFFAQAAGMGQVIPKIDAIAADINHQVFGRGAVAGARPKAGAGRSTAPAAPQGDESRMNPEKLYQQGFGSFEQGGRATPFIMTGEAGASYRGFWKSPNYRVSFNGLALGDVDGDGANEIVTITPDQVFIYRYENKRFFKAYQIPKASDKVFIGVDVADINGNGIPEIFVTALNRQRNALNSIVYEYDHSRRFKTVVDHSSWYYRVVDFSNRGKVLYGQKRGSEGPFSGAVYEMNWGSGEYVPANRLRLPREVNLLGFTAGDVKNDGKVTRLAYDESDRIQVIAAGGKVISKSTESYGGSTLYYLDRISDRGEVENPKYFPMRLLVRDLDGDGSNEVIVASNSEVAGRHLQRFRVFNKTHFESLVWDGIGLAPNWKTRTTAGFIRDFAVGDYDNDGVDELVAAVVLSEGTIVMSTPKSTIIAYEIKAKKKGKGKGKP